VLDLSNHVINEPFTFNVNGLINGRPFDVLGEAGLQSGDGVNEESAPLVVKLDVNVLDMALTATGEIKQPIINGGIDIDVSLIAKDLNKSFVLATGQSLNQYFVNVDQVIPLRFSSKLSNLEGDYELNDIKLKLADSDLKGKASLKLSSERPKLLASINSKKINIDRVLKKITKRNGIDKKATFGIPEIDLDFSWLKNFDADIRYVANQILVDGFVPEAVLLNATLNRGRLQVEQFDFSMGEALFRSRLSIDGRKIKPVIEAMAEVEGLNLLFLDKYLDMSALQQGRLNADINIKSVGENVKSLIMNLRGSSQFQLEQLRLIQTFNRRKYNIYIEALELNFADMDSPVLLSLSGNVNKEKVVMSGALLTMESLLNNRDTYFSVKANAFKTNLFADIVIAAPILLDEIDADFSISMPSLASSFDNVLKIFPGAKLDHEVPELQASVNAQLNISKNSVIAKNIKILIGKSDLQGEAAVDVSEEKIFISLDLSSGMIDINSLFPAMNGRVSEQGKSIKGNKLFSTEPLPSLIFLERFNSKVRYRLAKLMLNDESVKNISFDMVVNDGIVHVKPLKLDFEKGSINTNLILSDDNGFRFQLSSKIRRLDYDKLMVLLAVGEIARGDLDADINLQSVGNSISELMANLDGQVRVTSEGGSIDVGAMRLLSKDVSSLIPFTDKSDRQRIRCAVAQFNINDGVAKTHALVLDTGIVSALGSGEINFATEEVNLYVAPRTKRTSVMKLALVPLDIRGSLMLPAITPNVAGSTLSTTNTAMHIGLAVATGGITLLAEDLTNKLWQQFIDDTDYCALALAGEKVVPALTKLKGDNVVADEDGADEGSVEELDDDEF